MREAVLAGLVEQRFHSSSRNIVQRAACTKVVDESPVEDVHIRPHLSIQVGAQRVYLPLAASALGIV